MGIQGLHKEIKPYIRPSHISRYAGKRLGIDAFAWLHRGAISAAVPLVTGQAPWTETKPPTDPPWVAFCLRMIYMLLQHGAIPVVVFDGCRLPAKKVTAVKRGERKAKALAEGHALLAAGDVELAGKKFAQTVDITPAMTHHLIVKLK